jgi:hypothetical protein
MTLRLAGRLVMVMLALGVAACRGAEEEALPPAEPTTAVVAGAGNGGPPDVDNDAPAGICEGTANILSRVDRDPDSLFRAVALDNRVGNNDGDGILGVRFSIIGDNLAYTKIEETAPYCIFGGNERDCPPWPRDVAGRYTWGVDGPIVQPGRYHVLVEVFGTQPDSATGQDNCEWSFAMEVVNQQ